MAVVSHPEWMALSKPVKGRPQVRLFVCVFESASHVKLVRQIIDMLPYVSFKIEPSENKVLHRGFFTHKESPMEECARARASVRAGFGDLTSKEFRHMVANTYTQRETDRERAKGDAGRKNVKEQCCLLSVTEAGEAA